MQGKKRFSIGNKAITISTVLLVVIGFIMIASAEMGNNVSKPSEISSEIIKQSIDAVRGTLFRQGIYALVGLCAYFIIMNLRLYKVRYQIYYVFYVIILFGLLACRLFTETFGAYAWIRLPGNLSVQPSEFAKAFMILFGAKLLGKDRGEGNKNAIILFSVLSFIYFFIIWQIQNDFGTSIVFFSICFCMLLIPPYDEYKKIQKYMIYAIFIVIGVIALVLSPPFTKLLMKYKDNYMVGRFLAAANPFMYRYDNGYHVIMSLVSFASGNVLGMGYGNSIHKYMNFPNPSNDFILPILVEEFGIVGFIVLVILYFMLLIPIMHASIKAKYISSKMILLGTFIYFSVHFILNVGGVSAIIPLTGVPLLLISSGGSSLVASISTLGLAQAEIIRNKQVDENNSGQI